MNEMERIERLINRKLDGELSADEQLELDRALVRNPDYRNLLAEYEQLDVDCGEALRSIMATSDASSHRRPIRFADADKQTKKQGRSRMPRLWWVLPVAAAACIAVIGMIDRSPVTTDNAIQQPTIVQSRTPDVQPTPKRQKPDLTHRPAYVDNMRPRNNERRSPIDYGIVPASSTHVPRLEQHRDTGIIGVPGEDGKIYLIEVQNTRTYGQSQPRLRRSMKTRGL